MLKSFIKFLARLTGLLLALALLSLAYLHAFGLPDLLKEFLLGQLNRAGIAARFSAIRLDLFRGVVATDAVLADAREPGQTLAQIDELELKFNLRRLLRRQRMVLDAIRIANAVLSVPTPPDEAGPSQFNATDAYATFKFEEDGTIQIERLTGLYCGIRLNVTGRVKPRAASQETARPAQPGKGRFQFITKTVRELNRIHVTLPPQLDMDFDLDLARPLDGRATVRLTGSALEYRKVRLDSAAVQLEMLDGAIEIRQCMAKLYGGEVAIHGRYDIAMGRFDLNFSSTTDPTALAPALPDEAAAILRQIRVHQNPTITARYHLSAETGSLPQLQGAAHFGALDIRGVQLRSIKFRFENQGPEIKFTDAAIVTPEGRLLGHGQYHIESSDFSYEIDSTIDPTRLLPLMPPGMRRIVEPARFESPPRIVAKVSGDFVDPDAFTYDALLSADRCAYRGVPLEAASAILRLRQNQLDVQDIKLRRAEGELRGNLLADFHNHTLRFDLTTTANPTEMAGLLGQNAARMMQPYRFGPATNARAQGLIHFQDPSQTAWTAHVANEGFSYWKFTADRLHADLLFTNNTMRIDNFEADFYDGKLAGHAQFDFQGGDVEYRFELHTQRADVNKMLRAMRGEDSDVTGFLSGQIQLQGAGADLSTLEGKGKLEITDGVLWEAPLFGIFSLILGNTKATTAKATFKITKQAVKTDDLEVSAGPFTARSHGQLEFNGKLDFRVEAQFLRAWPGIGWIGRIIGQILEYKVGGTLANPNYRPVNLPKELLPHD